MIVNIDNIDNNDSNDNNDHNDCNDDNCSIAPITTYIILVKIRKKFIDLLE